MGIFGSKEPKQNTTILTNLPKKALFVEDGSTKKTEISRFYIVPTLGITELDGEPYYDVKALYPLIDYGDNESRTFVSASWKFGLGFNAVTELTNGKRSLFKVGDTSIFALEGTEPTFYPAFFKILGKASAQLLKIQAPLKWHQNLNRRLDPEITCVWKPEWK